MLLDPACIMLLPSFLPAEKTRKKAVHASESTVQTNVIECKQKCYIM